MATKPATTGYADDFTEMAGQQKRPQIAMLTVTKVIHEHVHVEKGGDYTMGELLDQQLKASAERGEEVQAIRLGFTEDEWPEYARAILSTGR